MPALQGLIDHQLRRWELERASRAAAPGRAQSPAQPQPVITVSREHGSGGSLVAGRIAKRFDYTLLHRDVIDRMCTSSGARRQLIAQLDAGAQSQIAVWCEALVSQHYTDASDYVRYLLETIRSIAELGGVVVVGRGANFIIGPDRGLNVRVVAPRELRIERVMEYQKLDRKHAIREVDLRDRGREAFARRLFGRDIADPGAYDLVVNTGALSLEATAALIETAAREKFERIRHAPRSEPAAAV